MAQADEWVDLGGNRLFGNRLTKSEFRELLLSARGHYQKAVDAAREWRVVAAAIERSAGGDAARRHVALLESMELRGLTDTRNFHLAMHRMVSEQALLEIEYARMADEARA